MSNPIIIDDKITRVFKRLGLDVANNSAKLKKQVATLSDSDQKIYNKIVEMDWQGKSIKVQGASDDLTAVIAEWSRINQEKIRIKDLKKVAVQIMNNAEFMKTGRRVNQISPGQELTEYEKAYYVLLHSGTKQNASKAMRDAIGNQDDEDAIELATKIGQIINKDKGLQEEFKNFANMSPEQRKDLIFYFADEVGRVLTGKSANIEFENSEQFNDKTAATYNSLKKTITLNEDKLKDNPDTDTLWKNLRDLIHDSNHENSHHAQKMNKMKSMPPLLLELSLINYIDPSEDGYLDQPYEVAPRAVGIGTTNALMKHIGMDKYVNG